ncbi:hypothetical protein F5Y10DRAFT_234646 [Nemania abortiva]|nr:hypothetical protein F5Y10DRAFT_234646 [Nemania abortiva]
MHFSIWPTSGTVVACSLALLWPIIPCLGTLYKYYARSSIQVAVTDEQDSHLKNSKKGLRERHPPGSLETDVLPAHGYL